MTRLYPITTTIDCIAIFLISYADPPSYRLSFDHASCIVAIRCSFILFLSFLYVQHKLITASPTPVAIHVDKTIHLSTG